jgi:penicillin-binding protein-related factor A (putative recombinase)
MKESQFNTEVLRSLQENGAWAYKIADQPTSWTAHATRFTPDKPCDIVAIYRGTGFIVEGKQIKKFEAFGANKIRPSQIKNMDEVVDKGGRAFVFLNIRIKAVKGVSSHENRLVILDWSKLRDTFQTGSIKAKELKELSYIEGFKDRFDLKSFLQDLVKA